jgi:hypothetical protein
VPFETRLASGSVCEDVDEVDAEVDAVEVDEAEDEEEFGFEEANAFSTAVSWS